MTRKFQEPKSRAREAEELKRRGYVLESEEYGPPATGKTIRARALQKKLKGDGRDVFVIDDRYNGAHGGVQVWASPINNLGTVETWEGSDAAKGAS